LVLLLSTLGIVLAIVRVGLFRARVCLVRGFLLGCSLVFRVIVYFYVVCVNIMGCCIKVFIVLVLLVVHCVCRCFCIVEVEALAFKNYKKKYYSEESENQNSQEVLSVCVLNTLSSTVKGCPANGGDFLVLDLLVWLFCVGYCCRDSPFI
jgi:hypothetical protein